MTPQVPAGQGAAPGTGGQTQGGAGQPGAGAQAPAGGMQGGSAGSEGSGGGNAVPRRPKQDATNPRGDDTVNLIDAAIPVLVNDSARHPDDVENGGPLPAVFGAAAVAVGGFHLAVRSPDRLRRNLMGGPPDGTDPDHRRHATPSDA